jgi:nucleoside-diphosphate-sugar epimerase
MERLLVLGRGWLGTAATDAARAAGIAVDSADRSTRSGLFDPSSDAGLRAAVEEADAVINACGRLQGDDDELEEANDHLARVVAGVAASDNTRLVHVGSAAEYGPPTTERLHEDDPTRPGGRYGQTKLAGTRAVLEECSPGLAVVARVFNPVGAGQPRHQPIAEFAHAALEGSGPIVIRNAATERDFVSIRDVGRSLVALAGLETIAHPLVNICSGVGLRYGDIAQDMLRQLGSDRTVRSLDEAGIVRVVGDPTRLADMTGLKLSASVDLIAELALAAG